jgi:hypothetical protein
MTADRAHRLARNEAFFRQVNERIREIAGNDLDSQHEFLCECADPTCTERIELSLREYERVRGRSARFVLARGHTAPEIEYVVERDEEHVVIEKVGLAGNVAADLDPRDS